jgi:ligand-binding sensor domain-containing protein
MTREYLVKENIIGDIESISAQIKQAEDMIEAILEDDFCKEENAAHELKWGEHNDYFTPTENGCSLWNFSRTKANTPEEKEQEHKEIMEIYALSDKRQEEMWDKLFAHLRANIMSWWS